MPDVHVVITGSGPVSAIGIGQEAFGQAWRAGRSGIAPLAAGAQAAAPAAAAAAAIGGFDVRDYLETEKAYLDRASQLAFAAMSLAIEDANLDLKNLDRSRIGLVFGTVCGCLESARVFIADLLEKGPRLVKPIIFPHTYANTTISLLAIEYGLSGFHLNFAGGLTAGAQAIAAGYEAIRRGRCSVAFVGGCNAAVIFRRAE